MPSYPPSTKEQIGAALEKAGQYANSPTVWTPENVKDVGLDPQQGFIAPKAAAPEASTAGPQLTPAQAKELEENPEQRAGPGPVTDQQPAAKEWTPPDPLVKEQSAAKAETKEWTPPDPLIPEKPQAKTETKTEAKEWKAPDPLIPEQPQAQQATVPAPVTTQQPPPVTYPTIAEDQPDTHDQIAALTAQGKNPGEAQAIASGREPKTINGKTPEPKPEKPAVKTLPAIPTDSTGGPVYDEKGNFLGTRPPWTGSAEQQQAAPSAKQPVTTHVETPRKIQGGNIQGTSTIFGLQYDGKTFDPGDNGRGAFGGANTRNPNLKGVAVPVDVLEATFGKFAQKNAKGGYDLLDTPEAKKVVQAIQSAHVEVLGDDGKIHNFPIVDIQGSLKGHPGKALDMTYGATREMGWNDNHKVSYQIVGGDGKPYAIDPDQLAAWNSGGGKGEPSTPGGPPAAPGVLGGALAGQPLFSIATAGGGESQQQPQKAAPFVSGRTVESEEDQGRQSGGLLGNIALGAILSDLFRDDTGRKKKKGQPAQEEEEEEEPSTGTSIVPAGMKLAKVFGVKTVPPAAPGQAQPQLNAPKLALPPPAPGIDLSVVKGLMKQGFTRQQAEDFAAKAAVSKPGAAAITEGKTFRPPAKQEAPAQPPARQTPPLPPPPPPSDLPPPSEQPEAKPETRPVPEEQRRLEELAPYVGLPSGSTHRNPNPPGIENLQGSLAEQAKQHAALLSEDDPRVKKQKDNYIKGEHFIEGDPYHEQLLSGLPYGKQGRQRQITGQAEQAIADKTPMHISYISAPKEAEKFPTRESRTVQYGEHSPEARLMGTTQGQLVGHSLIPLSVGIKLPDKKGQKAGEPHESYVQGISTNVMANNFQHLNDKLASMGRKTPYQNLGPKFYNDLEGYYHNLLAGHTATGRGYVTGTAEHPMGADRNHVPYKLTRKEADFIGAVINNSAAFAGHDDAKAIRELARANGSLITEKGETNRLLHDIEQADPGWSGRGSGKRGRVLEPSIKTFKTGLVHEVHPSEEHLPETIRPGKEYQQLTKALAHTSYRGRPDIAIAASLHHSFQDNKKINEIERDFSEDKINEQEARLRLTALGEDPDEYRFHGGSGGLITPYEDDPEALTPEEHSQMKDNLRQQWIGGKMNAEDYRRKTAEVPLPSKPSKPAASPETPKPESKPKAPPQEPSEPATEKLYRGIATGGQGHYYSPDKEWARQFTQSGQDHEIQERHVKSDDIHEPDESVEANDVEGVDKAISDAKAVGKKAVRLSEGKEQPNSVHVFDKTALIHPSKVVAAGPPATPPAPDEPLPPVKAFKPAGVKTPVAAAPKLPKLVKPKDKDGEWKNVPEEHKQSYLEEKVRRTLANQIQDKATHELKVQRDENGGVKYDPNGSPVYEQHDYDIANSPMLKKKALNQIKNADKHEDTLGNLIGPDGKEVIDPETEEPVKKHAHLNQIERRRLSAMHTVSAVHTMGDQIFDSYKEAIKNPEIAAGEGWYSRMRKRLGDALGEHHELFAQLLGATSAKTPVRTNFINALDAYEQWKEGMKDPTNMDLGFNKHIAKFLEAHGKLQEGEGALTQHMRDSGILKKKDPDHKTDADAMAHWIDHHKILPLAKTGSKYSANSNAVLKVLAGKWLQEVGAPKTPNFAGNLTGRTLEATIDVWAARHLQRLGYEGHGKGPWRAQSAAEPGVSNIDFAFSQDAMRHAAERIKKETGKDMNPDDLQAILWFAEKHHYEDRGWTRGQGAEKSSFDDVADRVFGKDGQPHHKPMDSEQLRAFYQAEAKALQQRKGKIKTAQSYLGTPHEQTKLPGYMEKHGLKHEEVHGAGAEGEEEEAA